MIWLGYDDASAINDNASKWAKNIWINTIEDYLKEKENNWYETPHNIIGVLQDPVTGLPVTNGSASVFYYVKGSEGNMIDADIKAKE